MNEIQQSVMVTADVRDYLFCSRCHSVCLIPLLPWQRKHFTSNRSNLSGDVKMPNIECKILTRIILVPCQWI